MSDDLKEKIKNAVSKVNDPHMGVSIVDMGIVQNIEVDDEGNVKISLKPTNPACMSVARMAADTKTLASEIEGVSKVEIFVEGHAMADSINEMINKN
ncbi:MAG: iron-sulfur cluster assembly protein [Methanobrevibacter sp.]|jgi:metal-sulfur cluster biosynthetic enzyme|nr:iron-sulfur cluster assembly protein [Candidatus Methanovirga aequatorialis]